MLSMADIKYTYFDLRVKGEPARLLLAYSGLKWVLFHQLSNIYLDLLNKTMKLNKVNTNYCIWWFRYTDERLPCPWDDGAPWTAIKPTLPWGQMPRLIWNGEVVCQSMTICRLVIRYYVHSNCILVKVYCPRMWYSWKEQPGDGPGGRDHWCCPGYHSS